VNDQIPVDQLIALADLGDRLALTRAAIADGALSRYRAGRALAETELRAARALADALHAATDDTPGAVREYFDSLDADDATALLTAAQMLIEQGQLSVRGRR
jgi:hypothetical protein